jgi:ribosomal protein S18 acetylase RimI-like enzyme
MTSTPPAAPTFKRMQVSDIDFLYSLCEATMQTYVASTWGGWNADAVRGGLLEGIKGGGFRSVYIGDQRVGAFAIEHHGSHIQIEQMYILAQFQNQGIGTAIVRGTIEQGQSRGKPIRLRVLACNPAKNLYKRLGFKVIESTKERISMEFAAPTLH